ncbi:hypothetical protein [Streptomyces jeddahensis]|uniref:Uncharacterized protein n=1 Tax=Streptomyces jeddahensis TaxID=1716141 RepID=A0A177HW13_9ACTN|nr:hypothetical protein [Streptomyces jeddahensis]OAH14318.1 hypothetical protein STSP_23790 [Streptomyces jeddahensis]
MKRLFRRCGHASGGLTSEDQVAVEQFRALLAALRDTEFWTPGGCQDIAVRVGPFIERAHTRPGDDHGPDFIAVALVHPDTPHAAAYLHGHSLGYPSKGWLRCETSTIIGVWNPAYAVLTHAAAGLNLPTDVGMPPANYAVHVEARRQDNTGYTLLRLGPYTQTWLAGHDADRLNTEVAGKAATVIPGFTVTAKSAPFEVSDHESYSDPYETDAVELLAAAIEEVTTA